MTTTTTEVSFSELPTTAPSSLPEARGADEDNFADFIETIPRWRRISSRQWVRDFRQCVSTVFDFPYRTFCKSFFVTSGYYIDMVKEEDYQIYKSKYPSSGRKSSRYSRGSQYAWTTSHPSFSTRLTSTSITNISSSGVTSEAKLPEFPSRVSRVRTKKSIEKANSAPTTASDTDIRSVDKSGKKSLTNRKARKVEPELLDKEEAGKPGVEGKVTK